MNDKKIILLKFGGSIITNDDQFESFKKETVINLMKQISKLSDDFQFIIVHGAGSFGHYHAKKYNLKQGFKEKGQLLGLVETHQSMLKLNSFLLDTIQEIGGIYPVSFSPINIVKTRDGSIISFDLENIKETLDLGLTPILFGDVVFDESLRFTILSGDKIVPYLAEKLTPIKIIMLTDVTGVYDDNPKKKPEAKLLAEINLNDTALLQKISANASSGKTRVTGEMEKKLLELKEVVKEGIETWIISGLEDQSLYNKLAHSDNKGTKLVFK